MNTQGKIMEPHEHTLLKHLQLTQAALDAIKAAEEHTNQAAKAASATLQNPERRRVTLAALDDLSEALDEATEPISLSLTTMKTLITRCLEESASRHLFLFEIPKQNLPDHGTDNGEVFLVATVADTQTQALADIERGLLLFWRGKDGNPTGVHTLPMRGYEVSTRQEFERAQQFYGPHAILPTPLLTHGLWFDRFTDPALCWITTLHSIPANPLKPPFKDTI